MKGGPAAGSCRVQVFMLSTEDRLDERTMQAILLSGHSRIPVYREGNRCGQGVGIQQFTLSN